jgi:hypothetical protein
MVLVVVTVEAGVMIETGIAAGFETVDAIAMQAMQITAAEMSGVRGECWN